MTHLFPRPYLIVDNTRPVDALYDLSTFIGSVVHCAFESAANPDRGPLPAEEMEAFKEQVRALRNV
jgi:hypothetical protein